MKKSFLILLLLACSPIVNETGLIRIGFLNAFDMPADAVDVDTYEIRVSKHVDTTIIPLQTLTGPDTLNITFNYKEPDNLPQGELPYTDFYRKIIVNSPAMWDSAQTAMVPMKEWLVLRAGKYQLIVIAKNTNPQQAHSGRYDFEIIGNVPVRVFIQGV